MTSTFW